MSDVNPGSRVWENGSLILPFACRQDVKAGTLPETLSIAVDPESLRLARKAPDPESVLLAVWQILLWRLTQQSPIEVGWLGWGQEHASMAPCASPVPLAASFSPAISAAEVVRQAQKAKSDREGVSNHGQGLDAVSCTVGFGTDQSRENAATRARYPMPYPLVLRVQTAHEPWNLELLYDPSSLRRDDVQWLARSYTTLLSGWAADPNSQAADLPLLSAQDFEQIVIRFNESRVDFPDQCVHELFEEQVRRTPHHPALRFHDQTFTYVELNRRANQVAHALRKRGVGPNVPVALFVERSAEMIIGLLGILKAGGCYVPLLHDDPQPRLAYLLAETAAPALLTTGKLLLRLPPYSGEILLFDDESVGAEPEDNPENQTKSADLVCVIYTSGSTGVPKGVAARHSNLANYIHFICRRLELSQYPEGWHFATVSTIAAILGNTSVFGSLMSGGCLHVIDYETAMSPHLFARYLAAHPIDVLKITPSQLSSLLNSGETSSLLPRRYLVIGGEKFTWELLEQIRQQGTCKVMNHYGPTETMGCSTFLVDEHDREEWKPASVPLGRPMSNQQLYILDQHLRAVPVGVPGELCMSGAGLTEGYFKQPELTAQKFVPHPFSTDPSRRLYRTGDLARFLPDGNIEFLGRVDHQVKIRGFRVEPAEVEAVLKRHLDIQQAVVVPEDSPGGEKLLAAYVVPTKPIETGELRSYLRQQLPDYMVPSRLLMLQALPLNRNGKVDLPVLATLFEGDYKSERAFVGPRNPEEEKLERMWAEVLGQERVSVHDNFFELGGHSLLATQIIARIRNEFRVQFPLFGFLEGPTISEMAARIGECPRVETEEEEMERVLRELEGISEEDARRLLAIEKNQAKGGGATE